jgi:NAD(P)-dependent dehydrogenase (short-subunit alcohol dehydrogenase family)
MSTFEIDGRTVLITGAARGIGRATAERLHAAGANVALVGLEPERLRSLADELGERALCKEVDATDVDALRDAVAATVERFGGIDVAIANAGVHWNGALDSTPLEQIEREIEINLLGVVRTAHAVLPQVLARRGYLLNIASLAAAAHAPLMSAYAASKAGVEAFSDSVRLEVRGSGARVGCAYFGVIETDMVRDAYALPAVQRAQDLMPGFVRRPVPVERAVDAIEDGIRRRRARVWAPRYVGGALALRGLMQPLTELRARRSAALADALELSRSDSRTPPAEDRSDRDRTEALS